ncbi:uncharacterized protein MONBRDRAFT_29618 [Monosiga brevicollis MX1]|uniref:Aromatic amino acid beta-eliminating lyase/threonine aldolase domain-containing protein n=1 Tax=Monosiga brevicollis TaxID=81824 RepID=A9VBM4_MONBE|nr:uncharacterized protein MONBRDRAFT_29618 [Monosiga brevicollis MX1]EDQ85088.1 predicted protein [Monosiga brevicollis MX1]|eukprot:XP_001750092.1 hypothetical protein [Monosiga brevicollis MX1]
MLRCIGSQTIIARGLALSGARVPGGVRRRPVRRRYHLLSPTTANAGSADNLIDLRSDTVTRPSQAMREAVLTAEVGDDVYGEDPTVTALERRAAQLLGKEAALFVPTGCMGNNIAIATHCQRGDELICGRSSHIFNYEGGAASVLFGVSMHTLDNRADGSLDLQQAERFAVRPDDQHFPRTSLLCLEDTHNMCGGRRLAADFTAQARAFCDRHGLQMHLDGARVCNAAVAAGVPLDEYVRAYDTVNVCLSKALGAPVGSVLTGPADFIRRARRTRKLLGGGMRQAGVIACAGLLALDNIERLAVDHGHARAFAAALASNPKFEVLPVDTNIVIFRPRDTAGLSGPEVISAFGKANIRLIHGIDTFHVRAVFHLDITPEMVDRACDVAATL